MSNRPALAQLPAFHAQVFGAEHGLAVGYISIVFKDNHHFLWVVENGTIQRFDGHNVYKHTFEFNVTQAFCDRDNQIWVLSNYKIWRNSHDRWGFNEIPFDTLANGQPCAIFQLRGRPFCTMTKKGFFAWNAKNGSFEPLETSLPPPVYTPGTLRFDTCGTTLFYPAKDGFVAGDLATGQFKKVPPPGLFASFCALSPEFGALTFYDGHSIWLDFNTGITKPIDAVQYGLSDQFRRMNLMDAQPIGDSLYMVTTRFGACTYDLRRDRFTRHRIFFEGKPVGLEEAMLRIFKDESDLFWAHNSSNIITFCSVRNRIGLLRNSSDDPIRSWSNRVKGFAEDKNGNIWFGGYNGFNMLNMKTGQVEIHPPVDDATDRLNHIGVRGMAYDGRYIILGPTLKGMWLYEPKTDRFRRPRYAEDSVRIKMDREFINGILPLRDGNYLICARHNTYRLTKNKYLLDVLHFPGSKENNISACEDSLGSIWIGSIKGISVLDQHGRFLFRIATENEQVHSIFQRSANEMLIGTNKGLRRISPANENGLWLKVESPVEKNTIMLIHRDQRKRFWFGTEIGLYLMDSSLTQFRHFDYADNIQSEAYHTFALLHASNGMLFMGGRNGINYFYPESFELEAPPLHVTLQTLCIGDGDSILWNPAKSLVFQHTQNTLSFEVVVPYYNNAGKLQYRYRLKKDGPWISNGGNNLIRLADLAAGHYTIAMEASVVGNRWYAAPSVDFYIKPAFWQRPVFWVMMAALMLLLIYLIFRYREHLRNKRQQQTLELEKLKTVALQFELEMEQVINFFNRTISQAQTVEDALWDVTHHCIAHLGLEDCVIYLLDADRQVLQQKAAWGDKSSPERKIIGPIEIPVGRGIVGAVAQSGKPELITDTGADPRYIPDDLARCSELAVPILDGNRVIGVIDTENSQKSYYTSWHLQLFTAIASLCSNKIALARSEEARRKALLEKVNSQRKAAEAKLQSLRLQMNPHFLFNALNSIQELILTENNDGAAMYLSKFSKLLRTVLTHSEQEFLSLRDEIGILNLYVELESLRFSDTFEFNLDWDPELDLDEHMLPTLLLQPFVENAIWHGLLHKKGKRKLSVRFESDEDENLVCTIEDNGIGRVAAYKINRDLHTDKGLSSSTERLQVLNERYNQQNILEINDLISEDGMPAGTRVRITLA